MLKFETEKGMRNESHCSSYYFAIRKEYSSRRRIKRITSRKSMRVLRSSEDGRKNGNINKINIGRQQFSG
jgi:hypothetical protein